MLQVKMFKVLKEVDDYYWLALIFIKLNTKANKLKVSG